MDSYIHEDFLQYDSTYYSKFLYVTSTEEKKRVEEQNVFS